MLLQNRRNDTPTDLGIKELAAGRASNLDIVAIHGLDGDREGIWTADNGTLWLRDLLPYDIPNARILTYGYDAATKGRTMLSKQTIHEHASNLVAKLVMYRLNTATQSRPIIFIAHSLGGIILKRALLIAVQANEQHLPRYKSFSTSTIGLIFLGTPHLGSANTVKFYWFLKLLSLVTPTNRKVVKHLRENSEMLQDLLSDYNAISVRFSTKFFYELYATPLIGGFSGMIVERHSAVVPGATNVEAIGLNKSHVGISQFPSKEDDDYKTVLMSILSFVGVDSKSTAIDL